MTARQYQEEIRQYLLEQFSLPPEQIEAMLPELIATLSDHITTLEVKLEERNLAELGRAGHAMKGALLNLGLTECAAIAHAIECEGKAGNRSEDFDNKVAALREKLDPYLG